MRTREKLIVEFESGRMGLSPNKDNARRVAERLSEWRRWIWDNAALQVAELAAGQHLSRSLQQQPPRQILGAG